MFTVQLELTKRLIKESKITISSLRSDLTQKEKEIRQLEESLIVLEALQKANCKKKELSV